MGNELVGQNAGGDIARRVGALYASIERDDSRSDTLPAPLSASVRQELQNYRRDLFARLQPISTALADREKASKAIAALLQGYINAKSLDLGATLRAYTTLIFDQPLFALLEALDDFRNGRVFDINAAGERIPFTLDHAPSAPRLLDQIKKRAAIVQEERFKVTRLLAITKTAEPKVSETERERVAILMRELANGMAVKSESIRVEEQKKIRDDAQAARDRAADIIQNARRRSDEAYFASQVEQANG